MRGAELGDLERIGRFGEDWRGGKRMIFFREEVDREVQSLRYFLARALALTFVWKQLQKFYSFN